MKSSLQGRAPTGRRLGSLLFGYLLVAVAAIVLAPFEPAWPTRIEWVVIGPAGFRIADLLLNLVLFVPLGFLLDRRGGGGLSPARVALVGLLFSLAIESAQQFIPGRWSTLADLVANSSGAWLGALLSGRLRTAIGDSSRLAGRLFLDLPLIGFLWLLVPLVWLDALAAGDKLALVAAVAAAGVALAAAWASTRPRLPVAKWRLLPVAAGWLAIALAPLALVAWDVALLAVAIFLVALTAGAGRFATLAARDRRVESRAVVVIIILLLPLLVSTTMPGIVPGLGDEPWEARRGILRWLAGIAAFTVLGYLMAERRGRGRSRWPDTAMGPMVIAALVTPLADAGRGIAGRLLPAILAAGFGALLFEAQRDHVIALRRRLVRRPAAGDVTNLAPGG